MRIRIDLTNPYAYYISQHTQPGKMMQARLLVTPGAYLVMVHGTIAGKRVIGFRKDFFEAFSHAHDLMQASCERVKVNRMR